MCMFFKERKGGQRERILITYGTYSVYMYVYIIGLIVRLYDTFGVGAFFKVISQRITRLKILERVYVFKFMLLIMADCGAAGKQIKLQYQVFFHIRPFPKNCKPYPTKIALLRHLGMDALVYQLNKGLVCLLCLS